MIASRSLLGAGLVLHYASGFPTFLPLDCGRTAWDHYAAHGEPLRFTCAGGSLLLEWSPIYPGAGDGPQARIPHPWAGEKGRPVRIERRAEGAR